MSNGKLVLTPEEKLIFRRKKRARIALRLCIFLSVIVFLIGQELVSIITSQGLLILSDQGFWFINGYAFLLAMVNLIFAIINIWLALVVVSNWFNRDIFEWLGMKKRPANKIF